MILAVQGQNTFFGQWIIKAKDGRDAGHILRSGQVVLLNEAVASVQGQGIHPEAVIANQKVAISVLQLGKNQQTRA